METHPPHSSELPIFHRKALSKGSHSGGVTAQDLIAFGGRARRGQFPYVASLLKASSSNAGYYHACTATLIAPNLLLTAGKHSDHCFLYKLSIFPRFTPHRTALITSPQCLNYRPLTLNPLFFPYLQLIVSSIPQTEHGTLLLKC